MAEMLFVSRIIGPVGIRVTVCSELGKTANSIPVVGTLGQVCPTLVAICERAGAQPCVVYHPSNDKFLAFGTTREEAKKQFEKDCPHLAASWSVFPDNNSRQFIVFEDWKTPGLVSLLCLQPPSERIIIEDKEVLVCFEFSLRDALRGAVFPASTPIPEEEEEDDSIMPPGEKRLLTLEEFLVILWDKMFETLVNALISTAEEQDE